MPLRARRVAHPVGQARKRYVDEREVVNAQTGFSQCGTALKNLPLRQHRSNFRATSVQFLLRRPEGAITRC